MGKARARERLTAAKSARDHMIVAAPGRSAICCWQLCLFLILMIAKGMSTEGALAVHQVAYYELLGGHSLLIPLTAIAYTE